MTIAIDAIPPLVAHVRELDGELYLCREVADAIGVSPSTLRRLAVRDPDRLSPTHEAEYGKVHVPLYDQAAVDRLYAHLAEHRSHRGRPRLWDDDERRARRTAHSAAGYRRRRAVELQERGDHDRATQSRRSRERLSTALRAAHDAREVERAGHE